MDDITPTPLRVELRPLSWLLDHQQPAHGKNHDKPSIEASYSEHGFVEPVVLDGRTELLLGGHGRIEVLDDWKQSGHVAPAGIQVRDDDWYVPTLEGLTSADDIEARRLVIRLNRLTERGGWDAAALTSYLDGDPEFISELWSGDELDDLFGDDDADLLDPTDPERDHTQLPPPRKGEPPPPRQAQGLRDFVVILQVPQHREVMEALATLRRAWGTDETPLLVHRAVTEAAKAVRDGVG